MREATIGVSCRGLLSLPALKKVVYATHNFLVGNAFSFGEFAAGNFDVASKFHLVEKIVKKFGIDEIRCGASVLGDKDGYRQILFPRRNCTHVNGRMAIAYRADCTDYMIKKRFDAWYKNFADELPISTRTHPCSSLPLDFPRSVSFFLVSV